MIKTKHKSSVHHVTLDGTHRDYERAHLYPLPEARSRVEVTTRKLLCAMLFFILSVFLSLFPNQVRAIDLKEGIEKLAKQLTQDTRVEKPLTLVVMDFTDLQGKTNAFGQYIAEQLTIKLSQSPKFRVIEVQRGHLRSYVERVLAELKFNMSDIVEPAQAKQLGKVLGVGGVRRGHDLRYDLRSIQIGAELRFQGPDHRGRDRQYLS